MVNNNIYYFVFEKDICILVTNAPKEQQLESGGDDLAEVSWRHQQQQSYAPPISSAADPYGAAGGYNVWSLPRI